MTNPTVKDLQELFGVSRMTVYNWLKRGKLIDLTWSSVLDFYAEEMKKFHRKEYLDELKGEGRIRRRPSLDGNYSRGGAFRARVGTGVVTRPVRRSTWDDPPQEDPQW